MAYLGLRENLGRETQSVANRRSEDSATTRDRCTGAPATNFRCRASVHCLWPIRPLNSVPTLDSPSVPLSNANLQNDIIRQNIPLPPGYSLNWLVSQLVSIPCSARHRAPGHFAPLHSAPRCAAAPTGLPPAPNHRQPHARFAQRQGHPAPPLLASALALRCAPRYE